MAELDSHAGRLCIVVGADSGAILDRFAEACATAAISVGFRLTEVAKTPTGSFRVARLPLGGQDAALLADLDILFWPDLRVDPLGWLRDSARQRPTVAVWPGRIAGRRAEYSEPGRRDYFSATLADTIVLRTRPVHFPDEIPYEVERIPA